MRLLIYILIVPIFILRILFIIITFPLVLILALIFKERETLIKAISKIYTEVVFYF